MTKELAISDKEQLSHLAETIRAIVSNARDLATIEMIAAKYLIGEEIVSSPLYKKHAKGQGDLFEDIAAETDMKRDTLADCVTLCEKYPDCTSKSLAKKLYLEFGAWRNVRFALHGGDPNSVQNIDQKCRHCPVHYPKSCP